MLAFMSAKARGITAKINDAREVGGASEVVRRAWARSKALLPQGQECSLRKVSTADALVFTNPFEAVHTVVGKNSSSFEESEFVHARSVSASTPPMGGGAWAPDYDLGSRSQAALCHLIAVSSPKSIIETGVAAGVSTTQILKALATQDSGTLLSIDVTLDVGEIIPSELKGRWQLEVLPERGRQKALRDILARHSNYQVFVHDSDHSEKWQRFEYEVASEVAGPDAILCSDDVEASPAFVDFCISRGLQPILLLDGCKVMGLVKLPA